LAATSTGLLKAQADEPFLNGRPFEAVGPPITIYEPIFATFRAMNEDKLPVDISPQDYESVEDFLARSANIYPTEADRRHAINKPLQDLLAMRFNSVQLVDKTANDGVIEQDFGQNACLLLIRELKNDGGAGDPSAQVGYSYARWWADPQVRISGTVIPITLTLSRGFTFASGHAAPASSSPSRVPGCACKEEYLSAKLGQCSH
jgi:hypothetical protein